MLSPVNVDNASAVLTRELNLPTQNNTKNRKKSQKWSCKLAETLVGNYLIVPLTSAKMLKSESYWMNSWCEEYESLCADQKSCIFSIRSRSGERQATLVLENHGNFWRLDRCSGPDNSEVLEEMRGDLDENGVLQTEWFGTEIYYVAHEVLRLMNSGGECH